jgi:cytochrome c oxidase assembly factor CtaG
MYGNAPATADNKGFYYTPLSTPESPTQQPFSGVVTGVPKTPSSLLRNITIDFLCFLIVALIAAVVVLILWQTGILFNTVVSYNTLSSQSSATSILTARKY